MNKVKLAVYWAGACGGCDIAIVELGEHLLEISQLADIVFWPCAMDFKLADVEAMPAGYIDITLFNGSIRTEENLHIAELLRAKSKGLVAFGSCATEGCVPGLSNIRGADYALERAYGPSAGTENAQNVIPGRSADLPDNLSLPDLCPRVSALQDVVAVDAFVRGCPPNHEQVWNAINQLLQEGLPQSGERLLGVDPRSLCDQCPRVRTGKIRVPRFKRIHEAIPDPNQCFLEQGFICAGPATHAGCGAACIKANMPCRGCYGPPAGVHDQGSAVLDAVVSGMGGQTDAAIREALSSIVDPIGTFYRYSYAVSLLNQAADQKIPQPAASEVEEGHRR